MKRKILNIKEINRELRKVSIKDYLKVDDELEYVLYTEKSGILVKTNCLYLAIKGMMNYKKYFLDEDDITISLRSKIDNYVYETITISKKDIFFTNDEDVDYYIGKFCHIFTLEGVYKNDLMLKIVEYLLDQGWTSEEVKDIEAFLYTKSDVEKYKIDINRTYEYLIRKIGLYNKDDVFYVIQ